ncbi:hypothetical protein VTO42DRAFT_4462 [Malbranchea cinnamomea]
MFSVEKAAELPPINRLTQKELETLRKYLEDSIGKGWIRESKSPVDVPVLFAPKADGSLRLCVDYRGLNLLMIKNRYLLPLIDEILNRLQGAQFFTKLDL